MNKKIEIVLGIICIDGKYLLCKGDTKSEDWGFLGGGVELGETKEDALSREILEEANVKVINPSLIGTRRALHNDKEKYFYWYEAEAISFDLVPGDDVNQLMLANKGEVIGLLGKRVVFIPESVLEYFELGKLIYSVKNVTLK